MCTLSNVILRKCVIYCGLMHHKNNPTASLNKTLTIIKTTVYFEMAALTVRMCKMKNSYSILVGKLEVAR